MRYLVRVYIPPTELDTVLAIVLAFSSDISSVSCSLPASIRLYSSMSCLLSSVLILILEIPEKSFRAAPSSWLIKRHRNLSGSVGGRSSTSFRNRCAMSFLSSREHSSKPSRMMYALVQFPNARSKSFSIRGSEERTASPLRQQF